MGLTYLNCKLCNQIHIDVAGGWIRCEGCGGIYCDYHIKDFFSFHSQGLVCNYCANLGADEATVLQFLLDKLNMTFEEAEQQCIEVQAEKQCQKELEVLRTRNFPLESLELIERDIIYYNGQTVDHTTIQLRPSE